MMVLVMYHETAHPRSAGGSRLNTGKVGQAINVPQRTYAYYESGQRMIPPQVLCALAKFYHVSVDYLLELTDDPVPKW